MPTKARNAVSIRLSISGCNVFSAAHSKPKISVAALAAIDSLSFPPCLNTGRRKPSETIRPGSAHVSVADVLPEPTFGPSPFSTRAPRRGEAL